MLRNETRKVSVGPLTLGGNNKVYIQSMCTTKTKDVAATVKQIKALEKAGCEIIRVAILDMEDAKAIKAIKSLINIPLVADIHFDYRLALTAIENGVDKIRLNPGNLTSEEHVRIVCEACKKRNIPIRIGVNTGSLPKDLTPSPENMVEAAKRHIRILEKYDFHDIVISLKASNLNLMVETYKLAAKEFKYPLHLGLTEAGTNYGGLIKGAMGIGSLLLAGIGNTIRVSLTADPLEEVKAAKYMLRFAGLINNIPELTSCPTCGRISYNMMPIAKEIEDYLLTINKDIHVAIMGCAVNGPGEAREADIGIAGGNGEALLFKKGQIIRKIKEENILTELKQEIDAFEK